MKSQVVSKVSIQRVEQEELNCSIILDTPMVPTVRLESIAGGFNMLNGSLVELMDTVDECTWVSLGLHPHSGSHAVLGQTFINTATKGCLSFDV